MGITKEDLLRKGRDLELSDKEWEQERKTREDVLNNYMWNDKWIEKTFKKIAILLTSHPGNRAYLKSSIETHAKLGYWICLAYDNYIHPWQKEFDYNAIMPAKEVMDKVDLFVQTTYQKWGGVAFPYFWALKWGTTILQDFEYVYCANGDFVLEKPEGFPELFKMLGNGDIMTSGPDKEYVANTAGFIARTGALRSIVRHIQDHFVPFSVYEKYTQEYGNAEGRFGRAIKDLGLKQISVDPPHDDMFKVPGKGTWYEKVGFRHIHAEMNYAYRNRGIPPPSKYLDERFTAEHDIKYIKLYEKTGNREVLNDWYPKE